MMSCNKIFCHSICTYHICYVSLWYQIKEESTVEKEKEILILSQKLTELKLKQKITEWSFYNTKNLTERQANAILDEKGRLERAIKAITKRLEELEK